MICQYCEAQHLTQSTYNISDVRERFNLTFYHHDIFGNTQPARTRIRCSPTYHSQVFKRHGLHFHQCSHKKPAPVREKTPAYTYSRQLRKSRDAPFKTSNGRNVYNSQEKWYDSGKTDLLKHLNGVQGESRERKMVDLASSQVFEGGLTVENAGICHQHCLRTQKNPELVESTAEIVSQESVPEQKRASPDENEDLPKKVAYHEQITFRKPSCPKPPKKAASKPSKPCFTVVRTKKRCLI